MFKKLMHNSMTAAAALLLVAACATNNNAQSGAATDNDDLVHVTQSGSVAPAAGPAKVDSDGNIYSSSAAPGTGNHSTVGTNTNVNVIPERSTVSVQTQDTTQQLNTGMVASGAPMDTTTTRVETTTVTQNQGTMTSSSTLDTQTTNNEETTTTTRTNTRRRMRKD